MHLRVLGFEGALQCGTRLLIIRFARQNSPALALGTLVISPRAVSLCAIQRIHDSRRRAALLLIDVSLASLPLQFQIHCIPQIAQFPPPGIFSHQLMKCRVGALAQPWDDSNFTSSIPACNSYRCLPCSMPSAANALKFWITTSSG